VNSTLDGKQKDSSVDDDLRALYADLEYALIEEMENSDQPSLHLVETVHDWSVSLHARGVLDTNAFETAQLLIADAGRLVGDDD